LNSSSCTSDGTIEFGDIATANTQVIVSSDDYYITIGGGVSASMLRAGGQEASAGALRPRLPDAAAVATMIGRRQMKNLDRITVDPAQMGGVPCVRHLRIPVATVLRLLAGGMAEHEILFDYPDLEKEDIRECLRFAAASAMEREMPLPHSV
jgi:uncharacterized protein (DUF433 family)